MSLSANNNEVLVSFTIIRSYSNSAHVKKVIFRPHPLPPSAVLLVKFVWHHPLHPKKEWPLIAFYRDG